MRVISGKVRGLKLNSPQGTDTRPTLDRVKEAVFSMLTPYISGAYVLDLFAGSGALGIEALSRGAEKAYFIDCSEASIKCIESNVLASKFQDTAVIKRVTAEKFLNSINTKFDIIFLDPPYNAGLYETTLLSIYNNNILSENGLIIVEWDFDIGFSNTIEGFTILKEKKYGRVGISVLGYKV